MHLRIEVVVHFGVRSRRPSPEPTLLVSHEVVYYDSADKP